LTGAKVNGKKLSPVQDGFVQHENGVWMYAIEFKVELPNIEIPEEEKPARLRSITIVNRDGEEEGTTP